MAAAKLSKPTPGRLLFEPVKAACRFSDEVIVAFSGGKDSVVTLDLCARHFKRVHAFFMYQVPGLSFQEATIRWAEKRYGIEIMRLPHFDMSAMLRYGTFRHEDFSVPNLSVTDIYHYARLQTGAYWIAAGERIADSIWRRAMMKQVGCIDRKRGRFYPLMYFTKRDVMSYVEHHRLKVSPESRLLGHSFRCLFPEDMFLVQKHYPADYEKIEAWFPFVGAGVDKFMRDCAENGKELP